MSIDWFTFVAQVVNFLVLVVLLHRFLYGPIVKAMRQREEKIEARLLEADEIRQQADRKAEVFREKTESLDRSREQFLQDARRAAEESRAQWLEEAREEVQRKRENWSQALVRERAGLLHTIHGLVTQQVIEATRRVLRELADAELERSMVGAFLRQLDALSDDRRQEVQAALGASEQPLVVRSAFELSGEQRGRLEAGLHERLRADRAVEFHTADELVCGIDLQVDSQKIGWSVENFLAGLEDELGALLGEKSAAATPAGKENERDG